MNIRLILKEINDRFIQENFKRIESALNSDPIDKGSFKFFTWTFTRAQTAVKLPHGLGFKPLDVIQLSVSSPDTATVTWKFDSFDATNICLSTSGACTVRAYVGRYGESQ